ncbi:DUF3795 domain-containing protein [bacterium]|nr:DUF3795 domain-containing protein [bacterium]
MSKLISICGLNCAECSAYIAYKTDDNALREKTAKEWSKQYGFAFTPEHINCAGCLEAEGPHIGHCSECEIRKCGQERGVANCAHCPDYACEKLAKFLDMVTAAKKNLEEIRANR